MVGHLLVLVAALVCLRLAWWQWERTQETTGTAQNFGYSLLWPAFAAAFIYMWTRFLQLESIKDDEEAAAFDDGLAEILAEGAPPAATDAPADPAPNRAPLSVATVEVDDEEDPELTAYNRALAALAEEDQRRAH